MALAPSTRQMPLRARLQLEVVPGAAPTSATIMEKRLPLRFYVMLTHSKVGVHTLSGVHVCLCGCNVTMFCSKLCFVFICQQPPSVNRHLFHSYFAHSLGGGGYRHEKVPVRAQVSPRRARLSLHNLDAAARQDRGRARLFRGALERVRAAAQLGEAEAQLQVSGGHEERGRERVVDSSSNLRGAPFRRESRSVELFGPVATRPRGVVNYEA